MLKQLGELPYEEKLELLNPLVNHEDENIRQEGEKIRQFISNAELACGTVLNIEPN